MRANEICAYWRHVHRCAFDKTTHILRIETGARAMIAAAVTVCAIAMIWFIEPNIAHHEAVVRLSLIAVILLVFPFVYGWQFLTTPPKLDVEAQKEIASLKKDTTDKKSAAEIMAIIDALGKAHAEAVTLVANTLPDSDFHRNRVATWTMDTLRTMRQLDMPKHEIFCFQNPAGLPDQDKCLRERQQLLRSLVEQYMRGQLK
jgi:hypothetical protein